jgi:hypothetical protein
MFMLGVMFGPNEVLVIVLVTAVVVFLITRGRPRQRKR